MKIIDNFLENQYLESLNDKIFSNTFPWYIGKKVKSDSFQFGHLIYSNNQVNSNTYDLVYPIFNKLNIKSLVKCKLNLTVREKTIFDYGYHIDTPFVDKNCKTAILYLNTNNGKTVFESKKVDSVINRVVIFSSTLKHTATSLTDKPTRVVLNINYY